MELVNLPVQDESPIRELAFVAPQRRELAVCRVGRGSAARLDEFDPVVQRPAALRGSQLFALELTQKRIEIGIREAGYVIDARIRAQPGHERDIGDLAGRRIPRQAYLERVDYFFQGVFFGAFTGLKSLPPAAIPSPWHFVHQTPVS